MLCLTRILMDITIENKKIEVIVGDSFSVGHVVRRILQKSVHKIRGAYLIFRVHSKHKLLGMLGRVFLISMLDSVIGRNIIRNVLSRWMVCLVIKLCQF